MNLFGKISILAVFMVINVSCGEDYYKILGIPRNSNEQQIRKSFKRLSLKFHPDKNKGKEKEAEKMFQKIVNAYEVLKDPEQRKIYDRHEVRRDQAIIKEQSGGVYLEISVILEHCEEGLKENQQRQQSKGSYNDMFSQFFTHGGGNFHQQKANFFSQSDVINLDIGQLSKFYRRQEVWVMFFYKSNKPESQNYKDVVRELASKYYGIFKVAGIDCIEEEELCEEFTVFEQPLLMAFPANINSEGLKYTGQKDITKIASFAVSQMESFTTLVREDNLDEFLTSYPGQYKVILFTQKKSTPPLLRALSKDFKDKLKIGEIRSSETNLVQKFQIQQFPTLLAITDIDNLKFEKYEGDMKKDQMMKFLRPYSHLQQIASKQKFDKPIKMSVAASKNHENCGRQDKYFCVLTIHAQNDQTTMPVLEQLANRFADDPVRFFFIEKSRIEFENIFDEEDTSEYPNLYIIKGKRMKYVYYDQQLEFNQIENFLNNILGGGGDFKKMHEMLHGNVFGDEKADL